MKIPFGIKFCEQHLDEILKNYWRISFDTAESIDFDLSITEWISTEEIVFLFSWIKELHKDHKITVYLPFPYELKTDKAYNIDRRRRTSLFLLSVWGMLTNIGLKDTDFKNIPDGYNSKSENIKESSHKIIPFTTLNENKKKANNSIYSIFTLDKDLQNLLVTHACYSPFESKIISHVITKELFINSLEHSGRENSYFAISLNEKWKTDKISFFNKRFSEEKLPDCIDFYKKKDIILDKLKKITLSEKQKESYHEQYIETKLSKYTDDFKNQSYVDFTFLDYGQGIYKTLSERYEKDEGRRLLSDKSKNKHIHSQILEYAFQMESSKDPLDRYEDEELIPRGLYFLVDMVRRFKGLLVARSGYGKVVYDFSDKIFVHKTSDNKLEFKIDRLYTINDAVRPVVNEDVFFDGTMISIVLPERESKNLKRSPVRPNIKELNETIFKSDDIAIYNYRKIFAPKTYEYLSMAFLYHEATMPKRMKEKPLDKKIKIYISNYIFRKIDEKLNELRGKTCILFIDFEFLSARDNYLRIINWLTNTPKINEQTKIVITNLNDDEEKVISEFKENFNKRNDVEFLYKAIPCIKIYNLSNKELLEKNIQWVGIKDKVHEDLLTNLFVGKKDDYPIEHFKEEKSEIISTAIQGHIISTQDNQVFSLVDKVETLISEYSKAKQKYIENWLIDEKNDVVINGYNAETKKLDYIYQTSKGKYQTKYVTLFETLHNKYIAEFIAKTLLDKYINKYVEGKEDIITFDKIVVVTISSQLIGFAIRNIIRKKEYDLLKSDYPTNTDGIPEVIPLANYFSFETETPFEKIKKGDKVIIVNDVISTGFMAQRLIDRISEKEAVVKAIMSVVDCRDKYDVNLEKYEKDITITSILSSKKNANFLIEKKDNKEDIENYSSETNTKRINPILNTIVTLKHEHSETARVLYKEPEKFFKLCPQMFKIGHYKQNVTHNCYFTDMSILLESDNGIKILKELKSVIETDNSLFIQNNDEALINLSNMKNYLNKLEKFAQNYSDKSNNKNLNTIKELVDKIEIEINKPVESNKESYKPDFIFRPAFSTIEKMNDYDFHKVFDTDIDNISLLQRYDTKNGWRFPFPAKWYNELIKGKHVLIIDSGSLTGDSLIQLIDSISFLEVSRIDFLSIIGRIEDFQREFYSRLRAIKIKNLKVGNADDNIQKIVPLNIMFGINLHIPPYHPEKCPVCTEMKMLESYLDENRKITFPEHAKQYIKKRINEIRLIEDKTRYEPEYIPVRREDKKIDYQAIFLMRDNLGKVDGYRFYQEYFEYFDKIPREGDIYKDRETLKNYELILICVLHEESLHGVLRDLLISVYAQCKKIVYDIIEGKKELSDLYYVWNRYAIIKLAFTLNEDMIYKIEKVESVLSFACDDMESINLISFKLFEPFYLEKKIRSVIIEMMEKYSSAEKKDSSDNKIYKKENVKDLIKELVKEMQFKKYENVHQAFQKLASFYISEMSINHYEFLQSQISAFRNLLQNDDPSNYNDIKMYISSIERKLNSTILECIKVIQESPIYDIDIENKDSYWGENNSLFSELKNITAIKEEIMNITEDTDLKAKFYDFEKAIITIQKTYLDRGKNFNVFCTKKHSVNLKNCINDIFKITNLNELVQLKEERRAKISGIDDCDVTVTGNELYFSCAFKEVFKNALKREENNDTNISLTYNSLTHKGRHFVKLTIEQDKPLITKPIDGKFKLTGGIEKIVKPVFNTFWGNTEDMKGIDFKYTEDSFSIIINFNI